MDRALLQRRLDALAARTAAVVDRRRGADPRPDDRFRGLYVDDGEVDRLLADPTSLGRRPDSVESPDDFPSDARLARLAADFGLSAFEMDLLLVALAPDVDPRFERLYGYLNDDVSRRRASIGLALELCGAELTDGDARACLSPAGRLVGGHLVAVEDPDRPYLTRGLRVPDRVTAHLLGQDQPEPGVAPLLVTAGRWPGSPSELAGQAELAGVELIYAHDTPGGAALAWLAASLARAGRPSVVVDLSLLDVTSDSERLAALAAREARLCSGALIATGVQHLADRGPGAVRPWADAPGLVVLCGTSVWDPRWARRPPLLVDALPLTDHQRAEVWSAALDGNGSDQLATAVRAYRLSPEQATIAARAASLRAATFGRRPEPEDIQTGARAQNAAGLERLAHRIVPRARFEDLVVTPVVDAQLRALAGRVSQRALVLDEWKLASAASRGRGVTVLFAGDSGTGKTMSAEVVAHSLGLDLYVIDLSSVVDKYIGETEKNLDRIFVEAERVNGVLLFDEADAIFGKRSEVKDARDRYANVEVAYLLQRMERFDGVAILTTNLRANVDEAFLRRIDVIVEFPIPTPPERYRLWQMMIKPEVPVTADIDVTFLADAFELSGGNIRNIVVAAAFEAATAGAPMTMAHLIRGAAAEYRKLGRLCVEAEFGPWFAELRV